MIWYILGFVLTVTLFGSTYFLLTPLGHGIGQNLKPLSDITFFTGIYFSIVTISSLGYGDMHPMGFSKALICVEVLGGLVMIGIMIAKVTSRRLSYYVSRLFSFDAQKRLEDFATQFDTFRVNLNAIMPELTTAYQSTPRQPSPPAEDRSALIARFQKIISDLELKCIELRDYLSAEMAPGNYFSLAPVSEMMRVGNTVEDTFFTLGQLLTNLSPQAKTEILVRPYRQRIAEAINAQKRVCDMVGQHATDQETRAVFQSVKDICERVLASYFSVPEESQPDQILQGTVEPQQFSGVENEHTDSP